MRKQVHSSQLKIPLRQEYRGEIEALRRSVAILQREVEVAHKELHRRTDEEDELTNMFEHALHRQKRRDSDYSTYLGGSDSDVSREVAACANTSRKDDVPRSLAGGGEMATTITPTSC